MMTGTGFIIPQHTFSPFHAGEAPYRLSRKFILVMESGVRVWPQHWGTPSNNSITIRYSTISEYVMNRRTLLSTTGALSVTIVAGCLGNDSSEPDYEIITDLPENIGVSDIKTEAFSTDLGDGLTVTGTLENTGDESTELPRIEAIFYGEGDVQLDDDVETNTFKSIGPDERVQFSFSYIGDPEEVTHYTLSFPDVESTTPDSSGESQTDEGETPTSEDEPELSSEQFSDDWADGQYTSNPKWNIRGDGERGYVEIVPEPSPDGGSNSFSLVGDRGGGSLAYTHQDLRFDVEWLTEAVFKPVTITNRNNFRFYLDSDFSGSFNSIGIVINVGFRDGPGETQLTTPNISGDHIQSSEPGIVINWQENQWYKLKCYHDGDGVYRLKVWETGQAEPPEYQTQSVGSTGGAEKSKLAISQYVGRGQEMRTNVARITHTTLPSSDDL